MAVTRNTYTGNGSTVLYSFTFPYLEATDIKVSVNGTTTTAYTLANATTIQFNTAPANGASIAIYRQTDDTALAAAFYPGSAIRSADLNDNFTQNLYVTQESNRDATDAIGYGQQAISTANGAVSTANAATATANTASSNASAAVATANTASSNASAAVSTANTASSNATSAVNTANAATATANSAAADAATAISTANSAVSTANSAVSTANSAVTTAGNAVTSANSAVSSATAAVSTANTASTNASNAVTTANTASSNASTALSTANSALSTANAAASAVANAILYDTVANVAAIPASPSNNDAVEVVDSTGIESFTPLSGKPAGFVGDSGLSVRIVYTTTGSTWTWIQYFPNDPENRYGDAITTLQTDLNTAEADILALDSAKLDSTTAASTYQTQAGMSSYLTTSAAGSTYAPLASPTFTGTPTGPSFTVTGSTVPTNGLYLPSAGSVAISTNSTGRLFIDSSGNVGVGGSVGFGAIDHGIHVTGSGAQEGIRLQTSAGSSGILEVYAESGGATLDTRGSGYIRFNNATTEWARFDSSGRLGIGSSSPSTKTHLYDASNVALKIESGGANYVETNFINTSAAYTLGIRPDTSNSLCIRDNTASATRVVLDSSGRLGIGTTSPAGRLHVSSSGTGTSAGSNIVISARSEASGRDAAIQFADGTTSAYIGMLSGAIYFADAGSTERCRLDSSGRLLVGTSSSSAEAKFIVQGGATASGGAMNIQRSLTTASAGSTIGFINFTNSANNVGATISADGDGTWNAGTSHPTLLKFSTTSDNASSPSERLRIASTGAFGLSGANYGSSGQVLTSQGSGAAPQWATAGGAWQFISSVTASNSASVAFTSGITSTYDVYMITAVNIVPTNDGAALYTRFSTDNGSTYVTGVYRAMASYNGSGDMFGNLMTIIPTMGTSAGDTACFKLIAYNFPSSGPFKLATTSGGSIDTSGMFVDHFAADRQLGARITSAVNAIQFTASSGNISSGTFRLYGLKNS